MHLYVILGCGIKKLSITCSLRGMLSEEISIKGPNRDLHSEYMEAQLTTH